MSSLRRIKKFQKKEKSKLAKEVLKNSAKVTAGKKRLK